MPVVLSDELKGKLKDAGLDPAEIVTIQDGATSLDAVEEVLRRVQDFAGATDLMVNAAISCSSTEAVTSCIEEGMEKSAGEAFTAGPRHGKLTEKLRQAAEALAAGEVTRPAPEPEVGKQ